MPVLGRPYGRPIFVGDAERARETPSPVRLERGRRRALGERETYPAIVAGAGRSGVHLFRVGDSSGKVPFDLAGCYRGLAVGVEVKVDRRVSPWWEAMMPNEWWRERTHQLAWLARYEYTGGLGLIVVCHFGSGKNYLLRSYPSVTMTRRRNMSSLLIGELGEGFSGWSEFIEGSASSDRSDCLKELVRTQALLRTSNIG